MHRACVDCLLCVVQCKRDVHVWCAGHVHKQTSEQREEGKKGRRKDEGTCFLLLAGVAGLA